MREGFKRMPQATDEWILQLGLGGKAVLTIAETARVLRICERSVREAIKEGWIPHVRLGRRILIPVPRLFALLARMDDDVDVSAMERKLGRPAPGER